MSRSYAAADIIQLPVLSASDAVVLSTQLKSALEATVKTEDSDASALPPSLLRAMDRLTCATTDLETSLAPTPTDPTEARAADSLLDDTWGAFHDWLRGWNRLSLPGQDETERLQGLYRALFADGLRFLQLSYKNQWQASKSRLDILAEEVNRQLLAGLGGTLFGVRLVEAHQRYGEVLGITNSTGQERAPEVREKLNALLLALRDYVLKVQATVEPEDAGTQAQAEALLKPLVDWAGR